MPNVRPCAKSMKIIRSDSRLNCEERKKVLLFRFGNTKLSNKVVKRGKFYSDHCNDITFNALVDMGIIQLAIAIE